MLWTHGPSTVRQVVEVLDRDTGYTTVLKLLQIMTEKGLVVRDEAQRAHIYESRYSEQKTQRQLLSDLVDRAFGGSAAASTRGINRKTARVISVVYCLMRAP